jgi:small-conductance mechanosensitive channel/CRP-like cAMP-binding protein
MIVSLVAFVLLLALRIWAVPEIMADLPAPYGGVVVHTLGVALILAGAVFVDRLIRRLYWDGYLRRKRNQETPALIEDIVTVALIVIGISIGLSFEAGMSVTGIITAGGATAIVIGIALQNVIQDLFAGLSINFDRSYAIGDQLTIFSDQFPEAKYGRVTGITWRSTYLLLTDGRRLMIPNRLVTSNPVLNHSRPPGPKRHAIELQVDIRFPSDRATSILLGEAFKIAREKGFSRSPEPSVLLSQLGQDAAFYKVRIYADPDEIEPETALAVVTAAMHRAMLRHGMPAPPYQVEMVPSPEGQRDFGEREVRQALHHVNLFSGALNDQQFAALKEHCTVLDIPRGKTFIRQGDTTASMFVIMEGAARVVVEKSGGETRDVAVLAGGEIVGEMSLMTGAPRTATVTAITPMRVIEIAKPAIEDLLKGSPDLLQRFSHVLAERQRELAALHDARAADTESDLLSKMKKFFSRVFA